MSRGMMSNLIVHTVGRFQEKWHQQFVYFFLEQVDAVVAVAIILVISSSSSSSSSSCIL